MLTCNRGFHWVCFSTIFANYSDKKLFATFLSESWKNLVWESVVMVNNSVLLWHNGEKNGKVLGLLPILLLNWFKSPLLRTSIIGEVLMRSVSDPLFFTEDENVFSTHHRQVVLTDIVSIHILINSISAEWNVDISIWCLHWAIVMGVFSCISDSVSLMSV